MSKGRNFGKIVNQQYSMETPQARVIKSHLHEDTSITLALFEDLKNAQQLRQCVMNGIFEAALLKASVILDPLQVLVSANKAIHMQKHNRMVTRNVHTEILFNLSPSKNISDSFRKFGLGDSDSAVVVVIVDDKHGKTLQTVTEHAQGKLTDIQQVSQLADMELIKKIYKLTEAETSVCPPIDAVVSRIASKEIVTV